MANVGRMSRPSENDGRAGGKRRPWRLAVPVLVLCGLGALLSGCNFNGPTFGESHGVDVQGHDIAKLYSGMVIAGLVVAAIVWSLIFWCIYRYRRRGRDEIPKQFQDHPLLEMTYTIIPLIIVIVIFVFTVITENEVDSLSHPAAATVTVTGFQWGWIFHYHDADGLTVRTTGAHEDLPSAYTASIYPQLVLPDNETTKIILESDDVIHAWYVHAFDFDRFAQPGIHNEFEITPDRIGVYPGQCIEYCGLYHSEMLFSVAVVSQKTYKEWLSYNEHHQGTQPKHFTKGFDETI